MGRPLKIDTSTSPVSFKEMSDADYDYATHIVLTQFAASNTGVGTVSPNSSFTLIGTFSDTYRPYTVGQHPVGTDITTVTYNFYQDLGAATENLVRPVHYSAGANTFEQDDTTLNTTIISNALANLVNSGVGSYSLSPTTPVGGTWVAERTIQNTTAAANNVTYLWRKTAATAPSTSRTLKVNTTSPISVKEMSDAEIQTLTERLRNRIVATGIGQYAVQSTAPVSGGTWVSRGSAFSDTRETTSTVSYTGSYTGAYSGAYSGNYTGAYTRFFAGSIGGYFSGTYTGFYTGFYSGSYSGSYSGLTLNAGTETVSTVSLWVRTA